MQLNRDTIAAIATPHGSGGIGIVRVSGQDVSQVIHFVLRRTLQPREATYTPFFDKDGNLVDRGIAIYFQAPNSYTGEDVLELQAHGGVGVLKALLRACFFSGVRQAAPGEFTYRAFINNKIDLLQVEAVADLIAATSEQASRSAVRTLCGEFSEAINLVVDKITDLRVLVESTIDFPEENFASKPEVEALAKIQKDLKQIINGANQGKVLRDGAHIVLIGQPNVGKSSLLNRLSGEDVALVSDVAGTTRDAIYQLININGVPIYFVDTAGLRESEDVVEKLGIDRTKQVIQNADVALILTDVNQSILEERARFSEVIPKTTPTIVVVNKIDKLGHPTNPQMDSEEQQVYISAKTGEGVDKLIDKILQLIGWSAEPSAFMARERHINALTCAEGHLYYAAESRMQPELFAEELRLAQESLGQITGKYTSDDLLGEIFSRFCLGK